MNEDIFNLGIKAIIRNSEGKILLLRVNLDQFQVKNKGAYLDIPGGRIHKDSTVEDTLKREVEEETGITSIKSFTKLDAVISNIRIPYENTTLGLILFIYICDIEDTKNVRLSNEHTEFGWFEPIEASKLLSVKYPKEFTDIIAKI